MPTDIDIMMQIILCNDMQGPSEGEPEPGSYAEELTKNVVVDGTPEGPQEVPPKVPGAINPNKPNFRD